MLLRICLKVIRSRIALTTKRMLGSWKFFFVFWSHLWECITKIPFCYAIMQQLACFTIALERKHNIFDCSFELKSVFWKETTHFFAFNVVSIWKFCHAIHWYAINIDKWNSYVHASKVWIILLCSNLYQLHKV